VKQELSFQVMTKENAENKCNQMKLELEEFEKQLKEREEELLEEMEV
jgi:hypothetical protein